MSGYVTVDRHWCLTEERDRVVPETDPAARWLHWRPGDVVDRAEAQRLGALPSEMDTAPKQVKPPANKARQKPADKGA